MERDSVGGGLGAQAIGLGDTQDVERLPECRVLDVAVLVHGVHDARL